MVFENLAVCKRVNPSYLYRYRKSVVTLYTNMMVRSLLF